MTVIDKFPSRNAMPNYSTFSNLVIVPHTLIISLKIFSKFSCKKSYIQAYIYIPSSKSDLHQLSALYSKYHQRGFPTITTFPCVTRSFLIKLLNFKSGNYKHSIHLILILTDAILVLSLPVFHWNKVSFQRVARCTTNKIKREWLLGKWDWRTLESLNFAWVLPVK